MPVYATGILFAAYAAIGVCALLTFHARREHALYVSQWYAVAALFWFPWILSAAAFLLLFSPVRGAMQSIVSGWYASGFYHLWLAPLALAGAFYFVPKLLGRPLHSRSLAVFGFWTLVFLAPWTGLTHLVAGPVPRWMYATSVAANVALLVPLLCVAANLHLTAAGQFRNAAASVPLRFILLGAACYVVSGALSIVLGLEPVSELTQFTLLGPARTMLAVLGFAALTLTGCLYYILPRLTTTEWSCSISTRVHFWCSAVGVALVALPLALGGVLHGLRLSDPSVDAAQVMRATVPFIGLSTLGFTVFLAGQVAFAVNVGLLLRGYCSVHCRPVAEFLLGPTPAEAEVKS
jgi:cytochrome c oxidase cbb3-type subunit 1